MLLRQSRTLLRQCCLLLRHCCWCGRAIEITYTVHLWLVGKRMVDFLFVLIEHFSLGLTISCKVLWADIVRNRCVWKGWVILSANFRRSGASPTNECWRQKTRLPGLSYGVVCVILWSCHLSKTPTFDRQTDRHTMTANTTLA